MNLKVLSEYLQTCAHSTQVKIGIVFQDVVILFSVSVD